MEREFDPMVGQWADPKAVVCRSCMFRDKTVLEFGGEVMAVGITRDTCEIFDGEEECKPHDVLFLNTDCPYYVEDSDAE